MSGAFDPYYKWLGIPPAEQPPNLYRLLGLVLYEPDADVIATAADRQMAHVKSFASGRYAEQSQRLLNELSAAKVRLLDPARKEEYDASLRAESEAAETPIRQAIPLAAPPAPVASAIPVAAQQPTPVGAVVPPAPVQTSPSGSENLDFGVSGSRSASQSSSSARRKKKAKKINVIGHVVAPILGLVAGFLVLRYLQSLKGSDAPPDSGAKVAAQDSGGASHTPKRANTVRETPADTTRNGTGNNNSEIENDNPPNVTGAAEIDAPPVRDNEPPPVPEKRPVEFFAELSKQLTLPVAGLTTEVPLGRFPVPPEDPCKLLLISAGVPDAPDQEYRLKPIESDAGSGEAQRWAVYLADKAAETEAATSQIGEFAYRDQALYFRWTSHAGGLPSQGLRNSLLNVSFGVKEKLVQLRPAVVVPHVVLDLTKKSQLLPLEIPDMPDAGQIKLEVTKLDPFDAPYKFAGEKQSGPLGQKITAEVTEPPEIFIHLDTPTRRGIPHLEIEAEYSIGPLGPFEFTMHRVNEQAKSFIQRGQAAEAAIPRLQANAQLLANRLNAANSIPIPSGAAAAAAAAAKNAQIARIQSQIRKNARQLVDARNAIPYLQEALKALEPVGHLGNALHEKAKIHYRLYLPVDYQGLELAVTLLESADVPQSTGDPTLDLIASGLPPASNPRTAVPDAAALSEALGALTAEFKSAYQQAQSPAAKLALAARLVTDGVAEKENAARQYELFRLAWTIAAGAGNVEAALTAAEQLVRRFEIDAIVLKTEVVTKTVAAASESEQRQAVLDAAERLADQAERDERYPQAVALVKIAAEAATELDEKDRAAELNDRLANLEQRQQVAAKLDEARATLADKPDDPAANLVLGKHLCYERNNWPKGLPHLAKSKADGLAAAAQTELDAEADKAEPLAVADAWWSAADVVEEPLQTKTRQHAARWYQKALSSLTGLAKLKAEKRVEEVGELPPDRVVDDTAPLAHRQTTEKSDAQWQNLLPISLVSAGRGTLQLQEDGSILAAGKNTGLDTYTVSGRVSLNRISAVRLEVLPDERFPKGGPGRAGPHGNIILAEFRAQRVTADDQTFPLIFSDAYADFAPPDSPATASINQDREDGWSIFPKVGQRHVAVFLLREKVAWQHDDVLTLVLEMGNRKFPGYNIGRFRLSVTDADPPPDLDDEAVSSSNGLSNVSGGSGTAEDVADDLRGQWETMVDSRRAEITIAREGGKWRVESRYLDERGEVVGLAHGEDITLADGKLSFERVWNKKPNGAVDEMQCILYLADGTLRYDWTSPGQSGTRTYSRVDNVADDLRGQWETMVDGYRALITVTEEGGAWRVEYQYFNRSGEVVGLAHGENVKLADGKLSFDRVWEKKPEARWFENTHFVFSPADGRLRYVWSAAGQSGTRFFQRAGR